MMSQNYLLFRTILFVWITLTSSATTTSNTVDKSNAIKSSTSTTYQLAPRKAIRNPRRANEETLTFSGDVEKMIEMANNRARDRAEAAADAAANDNTINVDNSNNDNVVDGNDSDIETTGGTEGADGSEEESVPTMEAPTTPPKGIDDGSEHSENSDMTRTLCPTDTDSLMAVPSAIPVLASDEVSSPAPVPIEPQVPAPAPAPAPVSVPENTPILHVATKSPTTVTTPPTGYPAEDTNEAIPSPSESAVVTASNPPTTADISQESSGWYPIPAVTVTQAPVSSPVLSPESVDLTPPTSPGGSELPVVTDENTPTNGSNTVPGSHNGSPSTTVEGSEEGLPLSTSAPSVMVPSTPMEGGQTPTQASPSVSSGGASPTASEPSSGTSPKDPKEPTVLSDSNNNGMPPSQTGGEGDNETIVVPGNDGNEELAAPVPTPSATNEPNDSPQPTTSSANSAPAGNDNVNDLTNGGDSDGDSVSDITTPSSSPPTPAVVFSPTVATPNSPTGALEHETIPTSPTSSGFDSSNTPTMDGYGDFASASFSPSPSDPAALESGGESPSSSETAQNSTADDNSSSLSASTNSPLSEGNVDGDNNSPSTMETNDNSPSSPTFSSPIASPAMAPTFESLSSPAPTFDAPDASTTISPTVDGPSLPTFSSPVASPVTSSTTDVDDENGNLDDSPSVANPSDVPISEESDANLDSSTESSATTGVPPGDKSPTESTDTVIACDESTLAWPETIEFTYSLETVSSNISVIDSIRRSTEQALSKDIANLLLPCGVRRLQSGSALGFEGIDYKPEDTSSISARCGPDVDIDNACTVIDGILTVYVVQQTDFDLTKYYTLTAVRESLGLVDGQVTGLVKATYLGPDIVNPAAFTPDGIEADGTVQEPDNLSTSLVLFAVGGCAFAASVGLVYYLRRQSYSSSGAATQAAGSDQQTSLRSGRDHPLSPFSEMLPSAYRFDQDGQMSAILELDDESATPRSAIAISESGFTIDEEGSSAISSLGDTASVTQNSVLGARKRQDESMDSLLELL